MTERIVLITGAAKNLGKALALALAQSGYSLICHYRNSRKEAHRLIEECQLFGVEAHAIEGDFSTPEGVHDFISKLNPYLENLYGLVNNVGNYKVGSAIKTDEASWFELFQTNLHAPFLLTRALLPMLIRNQGRIINIGISGLNCQKGFSHSTAYSLSKLALLGLTKSLAKELAKEEITVNMVSPGYLEISVNLPDDNKLPLKRAARFDEIIRAIEFLLDQKSGYITGQNIEVAGAIGL